MASGVWLNLESQRADTRRNNENSTRDANAYARFTTTGWGEIAFEECFEFGLTFIEEPYVACSMSLQDGDKLIEGRFPRASGGVYRWKKNHRGYYVGAWLFVTVETSSPNIYTSELDPGYELDHSFIFAGMAMKDLPDYLAEI